MFLNPANICGIFDISTSLPFDERTLKLYSTNWRTGPAGFTVADTCLTDGGVSEYCFALKDKPAARISLNYPNGGGAKCTIFMSSC